MQRTVQIRNESATYANYHVINQEARGVFTFDHPTGTVPPNAFVALNVTFCQAPQPTPF